MKLSIIFVLVFCHYPLYSQGQELEFDKDKDIQEALIGISRKMDRDCPTVLIFDEQMPELSISYIFIKRMQERGRQFIMLNLSENQLSALEERYGTRNPAEIIQNFLHILYRKRRCYTFEVWVKDPRILYPETVSNTNMYHPGWRRSDNVIIVAHHITKRYKTLISLRFWSLIPNIIGLKRNNYEDYGTIKVFTVLPYYKNGKSKSQEIDTWDGSRREFIRNTSNFFFDKFTNFYNASIVLGILWKEPFFIWGNKENPYLDGLDWRLFLLCQDNLNFSLSFKAVNTTGRKIGNTWSGMLGNLADRSIDVGVGGISITSDRLRYFDFCRSYYTDSFNFISPLNTVTNSAISTLFRPLSGDVWLVVFLTTFFGMIILKIVTTYEHRQAIARQNYFDDEYFLSFLNICGFLFTILCQKPYRHSPKTLSVQFVFYGISLTCFCLGLVFSSCLISFILSYKPSTAADKIDDILKSDLPIAIKDYEGHLNDYMQFSGNPTLAKIYEKAQLVNYYQSFDAMDDVAKGKKIYIDSKAKIHFSGRYRYSGSNGLKFHISSENVIQFANLGWAVHKNWPFKEPFDKIISRAVESGLVQHWIGYFMEGKFGGDEAYRIPNNFGLMDRKLGAQEVDPSIDMDGGFSPLSLKQIGGINTLLIVGFLLSIIIFVLECTAGISSKTWRVLQRWFRNWKSANKKQKLKGISTILKNAPSVIPSSSPKKNIKKAEPLKAKDSKPFVLKKKKAAYPELIWNDFGIQPKIRKSRFGKLPF